MGEGLEEVINNLARLESLIEECDEWLQTYWTLHTKKQLLENYAVDSEEVFQTRQQLDERVSEAEALLEGAKLELSRVTRLDVEESRQLAHKTRSFLSEFLARTALEHSNEAKVMSTDDLLSSLREMTTMRGE